MSITNSLTMAFRKALIGGTLIILASGMMFAGETLTITNGVTTVNGTAADCGLGATAGLICFAGNVGTWQVNSVEGDGFPDIGDPLNNPMLDLSAEAKTSAATAAPLTITFTETGFGPGISGLFTYMESGNLTSLNMSDTFSFAADGTTLPAGTNTMMSVKGAKAGTVTTVPPGGYEGSVPLTPFPTGMYTLTLKETIFPTALKSAIAKGAVVSSDFSLTGQVLTPEPGLYALTSFGLAGLLIVAMRRRKKQSVDA